MLITIMLINIVISSSKMLVKYHTHNQQVKIQTIKLPMSTNYTTNSIKSQYKTPNNLINTHFEHSITENLAETYFYLYTVVLLRQVRSYIIITETHKLREITLQASSMAKIGRKKNKKKWYKLC